MKKQNLDEMVFENRNKVYGAYQLRVNYEYHLTKALILGLGLAVLFSLGAFTWVNRTKEIIPVKENGILNVTEYTHPKSPKKEIKKLVSSSKPQAQKANIPPNPVDNQIITDVIPPNQDDLHDILTGLVDMAGPNIEPNLMDFPPAPDPVLALNTPVADPIKLDDILSVAQEVPEFMGGTEAFIKFMQKNLKYPSHAQKSGVEGKVFVKFVIEKDGSISQVSTLRGVGFGLDEEALRVVNAMPKWKPGRNGGLAVRVYFTLPIYFKLD